jgi:hypothetical protein
MIMKSGMKQGVIALLFVACHSQCSQLPALLRMAPSASAPALGWAPAAPCLYGYDWTTINECATCDVVKNQLFRGADDEQAMTTSTGLQPWSLQCCLVDRFIGYATTGRAIHLFTEHAMDV